MPKGKGNHLHEAGSWFRWPRSQPTKTQLTIWWFSKQKIQSLKKCIEIIRHVSGAYISNHIDKFKKICGLIVNCGFVPEERRTKIDWFLASAGSWTSIRSKQVMHAHCTNLMLQGTLTFGQIVRLYTHQCFSWYPHFQIEDLNKGDKYSNSITRFKGKGKNPQAFTLFL